MVDERDDNEHLLLGELRRHIPNKQEQQSSKRAAVPGIDGDPGHARHPVRLEPGGRGRAARPARQAAQPAGARVPAGILATGRAAGHHPGNLKISLEGLVTSLVITYGWIAPTCPVLNTKFTRPITKLRSLFEKFPPFQN